MAAFACVGVPQTPEPNADTAVFSSPQIFIWVGNDANAEERKEAPRIGSLHTIPTGERRNLRLCFIFLMLKPARARAPRLAVKPSDMRVLPQPKTTSTRTLPAAGGRP